VTFRVDILSLISGKTVVSLYDGFGVRGDAIAAGGGGINPSFVYASLSLPADAAKEYRFEITSWPSSGTVEVAEDLTLVYTPGADGTYYLVGDLWEYDPAVPIVTNLGALTVEFVVGDIFVDIVQGFTVYNSVTVDVSGSFAVYTSVTVDVSGSFAAQNAVTVDAVQGFAVQNAVTVDAVQGFAVQNAVNVDVTQGFAVYTSVTVDVSGSFAVLSAVAVDVAQDFAVYTSVTADVSGSFAVLNAVTLDAAQDFDIDATGSVSVDLAQDFAVRATLSVDCTQDFAVYNAVGVDCAQGFALQTGVQIDIGQDFALYNAVSFDSTQGFAISAAVVRDISQDFRISASAGGGDCPTAGEIVDELMTRTLEGGHAFADVLRIILAATTGRTTGAGSATEGFKSVDGSKYRVLTTFDSSGNRQSATLDGS
jgi:hypothetical protein